MGHYLKQRFLMCHESTILEHITLIVEKGSFSDYYEYFRNLMAKAPHEMLDLLEATEEYENGRKFLRKACDRFEKEINRGIYE